MKKPTNNGKEKKENENIIWNRLEELRKKHHLTQNKLCREYLHISDDKYRKWKDDSNGIDLVSVKTLCKLYNVSSDYISGRTDYTHIENEYISELTGLSDESIEVLRAIKEHTTDILGKDGTPDVKLNKFEKRTTDFINFELGLAYQNWKKNGDVDLIHSIFATMFEYISVEDTKYFHKVVGGREEVSQIYTTNNEKDFIVLDVNDLYRAERLQKITELLLNRKDLYSKREV